MAILLCSYLSGEGYKLSCPMFTNHKRTCNKYFGEAVTKYDIKTCQSKQTYQDCIFYKMMKQAKHKQCKYMEICGHVALKPVLNLPFSTVIEFAETYCLPPTNQKNCAIYKKIDALNRVPQNLLPDGSTITFEK